MLTRIEERNPHNPSQAIVILHSFLLSPVEFFFLEEMLRLFPRWTRSNVDFWSNGRSTDGSPTSSDRWFRNSQDRHQKCKCRSADHVTGEIDFSAAWRTSCQSLLLHWLARFQCGRSQQTARSDRNSEPWSTEVPGTDRRSLQVRPSEHKWWNTRRRSSAGVGRTGTYIAVDILMKIIDRAGDNALTTNVDVMGVVQKMRDDRGKMVQTKVRIFDRTSERIRRRY